MELNMKDVERFLSFPMVIAHLDMISGLGVMTF
jgi:hypothetical protein